MATKKTTKAVTNETDAVVGTTLEPVAESGYTKEQIIGSKRYTNYVDILNTVLIDHKYTLEEVDNLLKKFLNKEVD